MKGAEARPPMNRTRLALTVALIFVLVLTLFVASQTPAVFDGATLLSLLVLGGLLWVAR